MGVLPANRENLHHSQEFTLNPLNPHFRGELQSETDLVLKGRDFRSRRKRHYFPYAALAAEGNIGHWFRPSLGSASISKTAGAE